MLIIGKGIMVYVHTYVMNKSTNFSLQILQILQFIQNAVNGT